MLSAPWVVGHLDSTGNAGPGEFSFRLSARPFVDICVPTRRAMFYVVSTLALAAPKLNDAD
jgi:hypothetical protein